VTVESDFEEAIAHYSAPVRKKLAALRALVLETAKTTPGVGRIEEALKWGQHSFLTPETGSGSTIRIDGKRKDKDGCAMFFHCQSGLIEMFKDIYGQQLKYEGKRALIFRSGEELPVETLRHCIALALTHHLRKTTTVKVSKGK
jgi:Domain of unknown function (DU1801)